MKLFVAGLVALGILWAIDVQFNGGRYSDVVKVALMNVLRRWVDFHERIEDVTKSATAPAGRFSGKTFRFDVGGYLSSRESSPRWASCEHFTVS